MFHVMLTETESSPKTPHRENLPSRSIQNVQPQSTLPASAIGIMTKPTGLSATTPSARTSVAPRPHNAATLAKTTAATKAAPVANVNNKQEEYIPLDTCTSGNNQRQNHTLRQESVSSVPEEVAPPIPIYGPNLDNVFDATYDIPPSHEDNNDDDNEDLYKVPPPRPLTESLEPYDIPPPTKNSPVTPRSSSYDSQKFDRSSMPAYDILPNRSDSEPTADDIYDVPPSHSQGVMHEVPPGRPPKPGHLQTGSVGQEPYMNIPTNSKVFSDKSKPGKSVDLNSVVAPPPHKGMTLPTQEIAKLDLSEIYDFPKPSDNQSLSKLVNGEATDKLLMSTPPPPSVCNAGMIEHRYINAKGNVVEQKSDMYLAMDATISQPRKSSSTDNEVEYTDMSGKSSFDEPSESRQSLYDHPPPTRPAMPPPRPERPSGNI